MRNGKSEGDTRRLVEADPRFASGSWVGFWIQRGLGKQPMTLSLRFANGRVSGDGSDVIGRFRVAGTYGLESGYVRILKQYEQAHRVSYQGANQGDGLWLWGLWTLGGERGGFHLWPEAEDDPTRRGLRHGATAPAGSDDMLIKLPELVAMRL